jgi:hypothetical protein
MNRTTQRDESNKTRSFRAAFAARDRAAATPGFAIQITPDTDLGNAMLIVEDEEGHYEPLTAASTINEGREMAQDDLHSRQHRLENDEDPGLSPWEYKLWARGLDGMVVAATWNVSEL